MAQQINHRLSGASDFKEARPWRIMHPEEDGQPEGYRQPRYHVQCNDGDPLPVGFQNLIDSVDQTGQLRPENRMARLICDAKDDAVYLESMADVRNHIYNAPPNNDGTDLTHPNQISMYGHVRLLLCHIFLPGLYALRRPTTNISEPLAERYLNLDDYGRMLAIMNTASLLESDQWRRTGGFNGTGRLRTEFDWIPDFRKSIRDARESMVAAWAWSQDHGASFEDASTTALHDMPEMAQLIVILLDRERNFDKALHQEHIFGCQYDKRIKLLSSDDLSHLYDTLVTGPQGVPLGGRDLVIPYLRLYRVLDHLYAVMANYQRRLKKLFDYKYLFEWHWNKLWDQLYVVIHRDMKISDATIQQFNDWADNNGLVAQNLFTVRPIMATALAGQVCGVCLDDYSEINHPIGMVVLRTKCGHYLHPKCLFTAWDNQNWFQNRCPNCRSSAGRLRDVLANIDQDLDLQQDHEWENPGTQANDQHFYDEILQRVQQLRSLANVAIERKDAYWVNEIEYQVLGPLRNARAASRPSWSSMLGGPD